MRSHSDLSRLPGSRIAPIRIVSVAHVGPTTSPKGGRSVSHCLEAGSRPCYLQDPPLPHRHLALNLAYSHIRATIFNAGNTKTGASIAYDRSQAWRHPSLLFRNIVICISTAYGANGCPSTRHWALALLSLRLQPPQQSSRLGEPLCTLLVYHGLTPRCLQIDDVGSAIYRFLYPAAAQLHTLHLCDVCGGPLV